VTYLEKVIEAIRKHLGPEFVKPKNRKFRPDNATASWGCCYAAVEALWYLGAAEAGYVPAYLACGDMDSIFCSHWILIRADGRVLDPTADQFLYRPDYRHPVRCGFQTKKPSKRAKKLIDLVTASMRGWVV
jgi:hypothetical protein